MSSDPTARGFTRHEGWSFDTPSRQARRLLRMSEVKIFRRSRSSRVGPSAARAVSRDATVDGWMLLPGVHDAVKA